MNSKMAIDLRSLSIDKIQLLNNIYIDTQVDFNNFTAGLTKENSDTLAWLLHPLNGRNPNWSDLYTNICYIKLVDHLVRDNIDITEIIVQNPVQVRV